MDQVLKVLNGPGIEGIEWTMVLKVLNGPGIEGIEWTRY